MFLQTSNMLEVSLMIRLGLGPKTTWLVFCFRVILFWPTRLFRHSRKMFQHIIKNIEWFHSDKHHQWSSQRSLPAFTLPAFTSFDPTFKIHLILPFCHFNFKENHPQCCSEFYPNYLQQASSQ